MDSERKVHGLNNVFKKVLGICPEAMVGRRVGEVLGCIYLGNSSDPNACGRDPHCEECQIRKAADNAIVKGKVNETQAVLTIDLEGEPVDVSLFLRAVPFRHHGQRYAVVILDNLNKLSFIRRGQGANTGINSIIGEHESIRELKEFILEIAQYDFPVVIQGESGTGKELVAMAIHMESRRAGKFFVPVNCAALPHGLLESELFGHVRGSFTGALKDKKGRFELANGGTIFLDEIGDLDPSLQVKLLRVLQESSFERVGSTETMHVDVRVISATNRNLQEEIRAERFRLDLYYRICVAPIVLPPLRERLTDIPILANHFLKSAVSLHKNRRPSISSQAIDVLMGHSWPGNVRELQNVIQFAVMKSKSKKILPHHLPSYLTNNPKELSRAQRKKKLNKAQVMAALEKAKGNKRRAAAYLGVARSTLYRFLDGLKS